MFYSAEAGQLNVGNAGRGGESLVQEEKNKKPLTLLLFLKTAIWPLVIIIKLRPVTRNGPSCILFSSSCILIHF